MKREANNEFTVKLRGLTEDITNALLRDALTANNFTFKKVKVDVRTYNGVQCHLGTAFVVFENEEQVAEFERFVDSGRFVVNDLQLRNWNSRYRGSSHTLPRAPRPPPFKHRVSQHDPSTIAQWVQTHLSGISKEDLLAKSIFVSLDFLMVTSKKFYEISLIEFCINNPNTGIQDVAFIRSDTQILPEEQAEFEETKKEHGLDLSDMKTPSTPPYVLQLLLDKVRKTSLKKNVNEETYIIFCSPSSVDKVTHCLRYMEKEWANKQIIWPCLEIAPITLLCDHLFNTYPSKQCPKNPTEQFSTALLGNHHSGRCPLHSGMDIAYTCCQRENHLNVALVRFSAQKLGLISSFGKAIYESSVDIKHSEDHTKTYFFENQLDYNPRHGERYLRDRKEGLELEVIAKIIGQIHSKKESEELYQRCQELTVSKARLEANLIELKNNSTVDLTWKHKAQAAENGVQMVMEQIKYKKEALQRTQQQLSQMEETMAIIFQKYQEGRLEVYQKKKEAMKKIQEVDRKYAEQVAKRSREKTFLKVKANLLRKQIRELEARKNSKFEIAALKRSISEEEVVMGGLCEQIGRLKVELKDLIEEKKEMQEQCNELEEEQEKQHFLNTKIKTELQKNLATTREREKQLQRFVRNIEKDLEGLWFQYRPPNLQAITGGNLDLIKRDPVLHPAYRPSRNPTKEGVTDKDISKAACKTLQQFLREREVPWKIAECVLPADDPRVQLRGQHGVKAVANIRTNEVLGEYIGVLTASQTFEEENHSDSPTFHLKEKYLFGIDADVVLDSYGCGNKTLLINDGVYNTDIDRSNITYVPYQTKEEGVIRMFVMATRDIAKGEEILGAYGKDYWMNIKERDTRFQLIHAVIDKIKLLSGTNRISIRQ